jgi:Ferritin-like domain
MSTKFPALGDIPPAKALASITELSKSRALARRNFLRNVGLAGAGMAVGAVLEGCSGSGMSHAQSTVMPSDVLNFALNLEYLEAEFYAVATTGSTLSSSVTGGASMATGGAKVPFVTQEVQDMAFEIAQDEMLHVAFLRSALGSSAVAEPSINLNALGIGFANENDFLTLARAFEDTGVSAYAGAAPLLASNATYLQAAAQILAVEAYHAGGIRANLILKQNSWLPQTSGAALAAPAVPGALDSMDVPPQDPQPFSITAAHYFTTIQSPNNALAVIRNPSEVLAIVYANAAVGTKSGGFFPNGLNGNIATITTT